MTTFTSTDQLREAAGTDLGVSRWFTLTQDRIDSFADTTEDRQWIHVDPERAKDGPYGATVAHGYLTLSLLAAMFDDLVSFENFSAAINYGLDKVRFPSPAPVGSNVRGRARLVEVTDVPGGVQLLTEVSVERQGAEGQKPVCVAQALTRILA